MSKKLIVCDICGGDVETAKKAPARHKSSVACLASALIRLADKQREVDALKNRAFTYISENGRQLLVRMWNDEPWIFYRNPDGQWVSLEKIGLFIEEQEDECKHPNAVSAMNKAIESGMYCPDCKSVFAGEG